MDIFSYTVWGLDSGTHLMLTGGIHGDETCGVIALKRLQKAFEDGTFTLKRGRVTVVPIANPRAHAAGVRFIERNLNRRLVPTANPDSYEARLGNVLCPLLAECDALLDLHSYPHGRDPFAFLGANNPREQAFVGALGLKTVLTGWEDAYAATGRTRDAVHPDEGIGTEEYVRRCGGIATILECGDHHDPQAPTVAWNAVCRALNHFDLVPDAANDLPTLPAPRRVRMTAVVYRDDLGAFTRPWQHLDPVCQGDIVAHTAAGVPIHAPTNGYVVLPHADAPVGCEWFYWGVSESPAG